MANRNTTAKPRIESSAEQTQAQQTEPKKAMIPKEVDPNQYVTVRNGFQGRLVYKSKRTGERFVWDSFGAEQDMELSELKNARNSNKKYFINNWFMFDEPWVVDYIGMSQYYKFAISIQDFDKLFEKPAAEIGKGGIDSNRTIAALEKHLGTELIER